MRPSDEFVAIFDVIAAQREALLTMVAPDDLLDYLENEPRRKTAEAELKDAILRLGAFVADHYLKGNLSVQWLTADVQPAAQPSPSVPEPCKTESSKSEPPKQPDLPRAVLDRDVLRKLQASFDGRGLETESEVEPADSGAVEAIQRAFEVAGNTPENSLSAKKRNQEKKRLMRLCDTELKTWGTLSQAANQALTAWTTARLRALQDDKNDPEYQSVFQRLASHSKQTQPGTVLGLARDHRPKRKTWLDEARAREKELREFLPHQAAPKRDSGRADDAIRRLTERCRATILPAEFVTACREICALTSPDKRLARLAIPFVDELRGAGLYDLARAAEAEIQADNHSADSDHEHTAPVPVDWPHFHLTTGQTAVIVGGDPRPERREKLRDAFGFKHVEWIPNPKENGRGLDSLVQRMHNGTVDVVIALRAFSSHKVTDKLFANSNAPCRLILADSYGVNQVRMAIERFSGAA